jgi:hypothetical protein
LRNSSYLGVAQGANGILKSLNLVEEEFTTQNTKQNNKTTLNLMFIPKQSINRSSKLKFNLKLKLNFFLFSRKEEREEERK